MAEEVVATPTPVETPVAPAPDTVITSKGLENNEFSSEQLAEAIENMKAGKLHKDPSKVETPEAPKVEPVSEPVQESKVSEPPIAPVIDPAFDERVSKAVEAKIKEYNLAPKPVEPPKEQFSGFKTQEELTASFEKDPAGTFDKVVEFKVEQRMKDIEARLSQGLQPLKQDLENRTVSTHLNEAKAQVKEMADPTFMKSFEKAMKENSVVIDNAIKNGKNPYVEVAKIVRGEMVPTLEKSAYDRGVKETEARLAKAGRAIVEGGGKVIVETEGIDLDKASSSEILAELKRHGKA